MTTVETEPARQAMPDSTDAQTAGRQDRSGSRRRAPWGMLILLLCVGAGAAVYFYKYSGSSPRLNLNQTLAYLQQQVLGKTEATRAAEPKPPASRSAGPWNGAVALENGQAKAIGLQLVEVKPQIEPLKLELTGRTAYDPNSLNKVRPRFDTLVEKVHAEPGQQIHKGDPLVDLDSVDLAAAKSDLQAKYVQWQRDLRVLKLHEKLALEGATALQVYIDGQNAENKSRLDYATARDKLRILAVPDADVDPLIQKLGDLPATTAALGTIADKAKMTLRSRVDGIVIQREVVPGNFYDENDVLMTIAPLDHLWVQANVYEVDQAKVAVGQKLEIRFPFLQQTTQGTVEYVSSEVSRETRAVQIRASITNLGGKLKSDMLVKVALQIPPLKGQTVIPRLALVVINGNEYVFVKKNKGDTKTTDMFERRRVSVAQENSDFVVIASGLEAGETVATSGSLVLAQLYEDLQMVDTGMPVE
jgi:cobalt-zinc-cadmium efflux system membrane fusion protein